MNEKKPGNPWTKCLLIWVGVLFGLVLFVQMFDGAARRAASRSLIPSSSGRSTTATSARSPSPPTPAGNQLISGKLNERQDLPHHRPADAQVTDRLIQKGVTGPGQGEPSSRASG